MIRPRVLISFRSAQKAEPYLNALYASGIDPVPCQPGSNEAVESAHGLVLTGGSDMSPDYYQQQPHPELGPVDAERDAFELGLLAIADGADMPTLCICRGMQVLNVHRGGSLIQHLPQSPRHRRTDSPKSQPVHNVRVEQGSRLESILGTRQVTVNSRHHQGIDRLGRELAVSARDPEDGVIEAVEQPSRRFLIGVQWHPEDQAASDEVQRRLFDAFAEACRSKL